MAKQGEVKLQMGRNEVVLRPTPFALREVLTELGGARLLYGSLYNLEYRAFFGLIKAGVATADTKWTAKDTEALEKEIFDYGLTDLVEPCTRYLTLLINGGREPEENEEADDSGKG